jgi:hypothetical protein
MMAEAGQNPAKQKRSDELRSKVRTETFRMDMLLEGANMKARVTTDDRQGSYTNYYGQGALNVHSYGQVTYHDVYPGIDWIVYTTEKGIKYDFMRADTDRYASRTRRSLWTAEPIGTWQPDGPFRGGCPGEFSGGPVRGNAFHS